MTVDLSLMGHSFSHLGERGENGRVVGLSNDTWDVREIDIFCLYADLDIMDLKCNTAEHALKLSKGIIRYTRCEP
jgi:hypothetical protein